MLSPSQPWIVTSRIMRPRASRSARSPFWHIRLPSVSSGCFRSLTASFHDWGACDTMCVRVVVSSSLRACSAGCPPSGSPCASRRGRCRTRAGCRRSSRRSRRDRLCLRAYFKNCWPCEAGKSSSANPVPGVPGKPRVRVQGPALSLAGQPHGDLEPIRQLTLVVLLRHSLVGSRSPGTSRRHGSSTCPPYPADRSRRPC